MARLACSQSSMVKEPSGRSAMICKVDTAHLDAHQAEAQTVEHRLDQLRHPQSGPSFTCQPLIGHSR